MADTRTAPFYRGKTWYNGGTIDATDLSGIHLEGTVHVFPNADPADEMVRRNNGDVVCVCVRNTSTIALAPGRAVTWEALFRNRRVDGYCRITAEAVAGIVDEFLPSAGVAINDLFWLVVQGECRALSAFHGAGFNGDYVEDDPLYALTAAASTGNTGGRFQKWNGTFSAAETTNGGAGNILLNSFAHVMSALTTGQTNTNVLIHVNRRFK